MKRENYKEYQDSFISSVDDVNALKQKRLQEEEDWQKQRAQWAKEHVERVFDRNESELIKGTLD